MTYGFWADFSMLLLGVISALLILVVLLQRGRGGGLAGAFGGLGGQSAFGTKAGDVFTKITIGLVTVWVLLAGISGVLARMDSAKYEDDPAEVTTDDDSKDTGSSMSAIGDSPGEDEGTATGDETAGDDAAAGGSESEAAKDDSEPESSEKTEPEAAPADDQGDEDATSSEPETDSPDNNE